ncbi:MAG TPA: hypothetical protein VG309_11365, partial [Rhizomicrobium sp.]|nr:hypothetical protein [Rhizomicrobium sp.]
QKSANGSAHRGQAPANFHFKYHGQKTVGHWPQYPEADDPKHRSNAASPAGQSRGTDGAMNQPRITALFQDVVAFPRTITFRS